MIRRPRTSKTGAVYPDDADETVFGVMCACGNSSLCLFELNDDSNLAGGARMKNRRLVCFECAAKSVGEPSQPDSYQKYWLYGWEKWEYVGWIPFIPKFPNVLDPWNPPLTPPAPMLNPWAPSWTPPPRTDWVPPGSQGALWTQGVTAQVAPLALLGTQAQAAQPAAPAANAAVAAAAEPQLAADLAELRARVQALEGAVVDKFEALKVHIIQELRQPLLEHRKS
jgi:hypothetical protein